MATAPTPAQTPATPAAPLTVEARLDALKAKPKTAASSGSNAGIPRRYPPPRERQPGDDGGS